ncbi:glycosyltransferase [Streptomyces leeuwenhoekii]|uniref:Glycosyltransferase n=1 Tax=Streptomyces leeuwenhoekii TaxID=1437453 RepID=A0A0F7VYB6_STRLW|nr:glycosyltransferase [Streptomyces leeuwenhoekii]CQR62507.1 Glycosyltransferase [Streptomyces leeuwenhoekii]
MSEGGRRGARTARVRREIALVQGIEPLQVAELELGPDGGQGSTAGGAQAVLRPGPGSGPVTTGEVFVLVRRGGRPVGTLLVRVPEGADPEQVLTALARAAERRAGGSRAGAPGGTTGGSGSERPGDTRGGTRPERPGDTTDGTGPERPGDTTDGTGPERPGGRAGRSGHVPPGPPRTAVVVATRERAGQLARALDSLLAQDHPRFEIVVVDNAPATEETRELIERKYGERVRYVREPVPGLAVAHNRGLAAVRSEVVAFTDDDVVADPRWLTELTTPFAADPGLGCATGLILPARLRTPAQVLLESHGGFAKGFAPRTYDPERPPAGEPLFPFAAGRFGSGANMAFRTEVLRRVGGFDPATGAGTPARGGDDLYGFVRVLAQGHRLHYTPRALVWHHHRETWRDLETQAYGYGAGLTAYLTAILVNRPALLPAFLARLPRGLARARTLSAARRADGAAGAPGGHDARTHPWPHRLSRLQRRGMLYGPVGYLRARHALRTLTREAR